MTEKQAPDPDIALARECAARMLAGDRAAVDLGITIDVPAPGLAVARMEVRAGMINGFGICHGGYLFTLADTAFAYACNGYGEITVAAGASVDFLRPAQVGERLTAEARERHRGRSSGVYDVTVTGADGRTVALFRGRSRTTGRPIPPARGGT